MIDIDWNRLSLAILIVMSIYGAIGIIYGICDVYIFNRSMWHGLDDGCRQISMSPRGQRIVGKEPPGLLDFVMFMLFWPMVLYTDWTDRLDGIANGCEIDDWKEQG